jgi:hypothetical protein
MNKLMLVVLVCCFMLDFCLAYKSNLRIEAICSSETSVDIYWSTWHYTRIPEDRTLHNLDLAWYSSMQERPKCDMITFMDVRASP